MSLNTYVKDPDIKDFRTVGVNNALLVALFPRHTHTAAAALWHHWRGAAYAFRANCNVRVADLYVNKPVNTNG